MLSKKEYFLFVVQSNKEESLPTFRREKNKKGDKFREINGV